MRPDGERHVVIVGGGIGGLTAALFLHKHGIACDVFERATAIRELGVGINLMPQAVGIFAEIGLQPQIEETGIAPDHLYYRTMTGAVAWDEPRGRAAGLPFPQVSIHRGWLQGVLHRAFEARSPGHVHCDRRFVGFEQDGAGVVAQFEDSDGRQHEARGAVLIGADGINSALRGMLFPQEGGPRWSGRIMWRGTADWPCFGDGRSFVIAGSNDSRLVLFPIAPGRTAGTRLTNWVLVHRIDADGADWHGGQDWQNRADRDRCLAAAAEFALPDCDVRGLVAASEHIYEFPMSDRDPLPHWSFGRVTLLGDAAHPMYPFGGNGAAQATLDAKALAAALAAAPTPEAALRAYEDERLDAVYRVVLTNRKGGPERVIDMVEARMAADGIRPEDIPRDERQAILQDYSRIAGYSREQLERHVS